MSKNAIQASPISTIASPWQAFSPICAPPRRSSLPVRRRSTAAQADLLVQDLAGLASGVISRTRAEAAESWQGIFRRATGDRHWLLVGSGALSATFLTGLFTTALLAFGPEPEAQKT